MKYNLFEGLLMVQRYPVQCLFFALISVPPYTLKGTRVVKVRRV